MKTITKTIKKFVSRSPKKAFFVTVRCSDCGEEVMVRINRSSDFQMAYEPHNPKHFYTVKKEIVGKNCYHLMRLTLALTKNIRVLYADTDACEFIKFDRE